MMSSNLRRVGVTLMTLMLVIGLIFVWLLGTNSGLKFALSKIEGLKINHIEGRLIDRLEARGITLELDNTTVAIESLAMRWKPWTLISPQSVDIDTIDVDKLTVKVSRQEGGANSEDQISGFEIPINVSIDQLDISRLSWQINRSKQQTLDSLTGNALRLEGSQLNVEELRVNHGDEFASLNGKADLMLRSNGAVDLQFKHSTGALIGLSDVLVGFHSVDGTWEQLTIRSNLSGLVEGSYTGVLRQVLTTKPSWDIDGELTKYNQLREGQLNLAFSVKGSLDQIEVNTDLGFESAVLGSLLPQTTATLNATIGNIRSEAMFDMQLEFKNAHHLAKAFGTELPQLSGNVRLHGVTTGYEVDANFSVRDERLGAIRVAIPASGDLQSLSSNALSVSGDKLSLNSELIIDYPSEGKTQIKLFNTRGHMAQRKLVVFADLSLFNNSIEVNKLDLRVGESRANVKGTINELVELDWQISIKNLSDVLPGSTGRIFSNGRFLGSLVTPEIDASLELKNINFQDVVIESGIGELKVNYESMNGKLTLGNLTVNDYNLIESSVMTLSGTFDKHRLNILSRFADAKSQTVGATLEGSFQENEFDFLLKSDTLPLSLTRNLTKTLPYNLTGLIGLTGQGQYRFDTHKLNATGGLTSQEISLVAKEKGQRDISLTGLELQLETQGNHSQFVLSSNLDAQGKVTATGKVNAGVLSNQFLTSKLELVADVDYPDITNLKLILPSNTNLEGAFEASLTVNGSINEPEQRIQASLTRGRLSLLEQGLELKNLNLSMHPGLNNDVEFEAEALAGEGTVSANGTLSLNKDSHQAQIKLIANDALLLNRPDLNVQIDADLTIHIKETETAIAGDAQILQAYLSTGSAPGVITESPDLVISDGYIKPTERRTNFDIKLDLGTNTQISASGFKGRLTGAPRLKTTTNGLLTSTGEIQVQDGKFSILGEELKVTKGIAWYTGGSIATPLIDIEAAKSIGSTTAGVKITGNADSPTITLISKPYFSDQDILSLIFFDKPLDDLGTVDALRLIRIANALRGGDMGASRIDSIQDSVASYLGIEKLDVNVETAGGKQGVSVSSKINSRINIGYAYNIVSALQSLFLRYKINDNWSIQSSVDTETGADLVYKNER